MSQMQKAALEAEVQRVIASGAVTAEDRRTCAQIGVSVETYVRSILTARFPTPAESALRARLLESASRRPADTDPALSAICRSINVDPALLRFPAVETAVRKVAEVRSRNQASSRRSSSAPPRSLRGRKPLETAA